jgi:hypothetical protein
MIKSLIIVFGILCGIQTLAWGQGGGRRASINWSAIDENRHSALLVELKNKEDTNGLIKLRTEMQNIDRAENVGIIFEDGRFQFVLAVESREAAVLDQVKNEVQRKMGNAEVIFIHKTPQQLRAELQSAE